MLYRADWHETLTERTWNDAPVRDAVAALVQDAVAAYDPDELWPAHASDGDGDPGPLFDVYSGAAGMAWALARLDADFDAVGAARRAHERFVSAPPEVPPVLPREWRSSLLAAETGIAYVAQAPRDELLRLIRANLANPANELMWGVAGTLLVARAIGAEDAVRESEDALREARDADGWWTQRLYGHTFQSLGPVHGLVGNAFALDDLAPTVDIVRDLALRENGHVNWMPGPGDRNVRLQWCHGAPGLITTLGALLDEDLLLGGAQLTWDAGPFEPLDKGAGICHGTAGNGYALLKTFEVTQDELWLERARAFAVHALEQAQALPPRYSLFTGGIGVALYARDCLAERVSFPVLDWLVE